MIGGNSGPHDRLMQKGAQLPSITQSVHIALQELLCKSPHHYLEEMQGFLLRQFSVLVSKSTMSRTLKRIHWSKKIMRRKAKERNPDLRDFYMYKISRFHSWQLFSWMSLAATGAPL